MTMFGLIQEWLRRRREPAPVQPVTHLDWFDLDPPPVGVNPTPLFPDPQPSKPRWVFRGDPWLEPDAELALHYPWCGIHDSESGVCTERCRDTTP